MILTDLRKEKYMKLIDADRLMEDFRNTITEQSDTYDWLNMISR